MDKLSSIDLRVLYEHSSRNVYDAIIDTVINISQDETFDLATALAPIWLLRNMMHVTDWTKLADAALQILYAKNEYAKIEAEVLNKNN